METKVENPKSAYLLDEWLKEYRKTYLSHAIWEDNLDLVFKDLKLMSSEELFRVKHRVSYEKGSYAERKLISYDVEIEKDFIQEVLIPEFGSLLFLKELQVGENELSKDALDYFTPLITIPELNPDGTSSDAVKPEKIKAALERLKSKHKYLKFYNIYAKSNLNIDLDTFLSNTKDPLKSAHYRMLHDENFSKMKFDEILSILVKNNLLSLEDALELRRREFGIDHKLNQEIRCSVAAVRHSYGDVAILIGDPKKYLSQIQPREISKTLDFKTLTESQEAFLKCPLENDGKFFNVSLKDESVIVVGEKAHLQKYEEELKLNKIRYFFYEDMTEEQKASFNWKPKVIEATKPPQEKLVEEKPIHKDEEENKNRLATFMKNIKEGRLDLSEAVIEFECLFKNLHSSDIRNDFIKEMLLIPENFELLHDYTKRFSDSNDNWKLKYSLVNILCMVFPIALSFQEFEKRVFLNAFQLNNRVKGAPLDYWLSRNRYEKFGKFLKNREDFESLWSIKADRPTILEMCVKPSYGVNYPLLDQPHVVGELSSEEIATLLVQSNLSMTDLVHVSGMKVIQPLLRDEKAVGILRTKFERIHNLALLDSHCLLLIDKRCQFSDEERELLIGMHLHPPTLLKFRLVFRAFPEILVKHLGKNVYQATQIFMNTKFECPNEILKVLFDKLRDVKLLQEKLPASVITSLIDKGIIPKFNDPKLGNAAFETCLKFKEYKKLFLSNLEAIASLSLTNKATLLTHLTPEEVAQHVQVLKDVLSNLAAADFLRKKPLNIASLVPSSMKHEFLLEPGYQFLFEERKLLIEDIFLELMPNQIHQLLTEANKPALESFLLEENRDVALHLFKKNFHHFDSEKILKKLFTAHLDDEVFQRELPIEAIHYLISEGIIADFNDAELGSASFEMCLKFVNYKKYLLDTPDAVAILSLKNKATLLLHLTPEEMAQNVQLLKALLSNQEAIEILRKQPGGVASLIPSSSKYTFLVDEQYLFSPNERVSLIEAVFPELESNEQIQGLLTETNKTKFVSFLQNDVKAALRLLNQNLHQDLDKESLTNLFNAHRENVDFQKQLSLDAIIDLTRQDIIPNLNLNDDPLTNVAQNIVKLFSFTNFKQNLFKSITIPRFLDLISDKVAVGILGKFDAPPYLNPFFEQLAVAQLTNELKEKLKGFLTSSDKMGWLCPTAVVPNQPQFAAGEVYGLIDACSRLDLIDDNLKRTQNFTLNLVKVLQTSSASLAAKFSDERSKILKVVLEHHSSLVFSSLLTQSNNRLLPSEYMQIIEHFLAKKNYQKNYFLKQLSGNGYFTETIITHLLEDQETAIKLLNSPLINPELNIISPEQIRKALIKHLNVEGANNPKLPIPVFLSKLNLTFFGNHPVTSMVQEVSHPLYMKKLFDTAKSNIRVAHQALHNHARRTLADQKIKSLENDRQDILEEVRTPEELSRYFSIPGDITTIKEKYAKKDILNPDQVATLFACHGHDLLKKMTTRLLGFCYKTILKNDNNDDAVNTLTSLPEFFTRLKREDKTLPNLELNIKNALKTYDKAILTYRKLKNLIDIWRLWHNSGSTILSPGRWFKPEGMSQTMLDLKRIVAEFPKDVDLDTKISDTVVDKLVTLIKAEGSRSSKSSNNPKSHTSQLIAALKTTATYIENNEDPTTIFIYS